MERIAIAGATGYIGGRLAPELLKRRLLAPLPGPLPS